MPSNLPGLHAELPFPEGSTPVAVGVLGNEPAMAPADFGWDSFFLGNLLPSEDFMGE